ncbi:hypothetical protein GGR51DRAFT_518224 [Nemania sp. FL0031]|nr:hypothetical protein GGR51DRAFT_518224 [Nemania sp. FL0031]
MRRRILSQRFCAVSHGFHARQIRTKSSTSQRFSIIASPKLTQRQVLDGLKSHTLKTTQQAQHEASEADGVAILASKDFTSWLEDQNFMAAFLKTLLNPVSTTQANRPSLHVLSGIADGLSPHQLCGESRSGFSILRGPVDSILPGLWEKESFSATSQDSAACVSFTANPLRGNTSALEVTLPLANTVFQNGRRSTLYASRWDTSSDDLKTLGTKYPKTIQQINANGGSVNHASSIIPLLPLTPPRRIAVGLGNIIRQVEVDGVRTPASKELEAIIPKIFEERAQRDPSSPRPIGVWCWVIPPHIGPEKFGDLKLFKAGSSLTEAEIALDSMEVFSGLLSSGCRLHKILSGGGGWGLKQGLLSLDPETSFPVPGQDDDDMEMFIRSFKERDSGNPTAGGLATPGSSLLFCVEPQIANIEGLSSRLLAPKDTLAFGVSPSLDDTPSSSSPTNSVDIIDGHFGISSSTGLFLRSNANCTGADNRNEMQGASQGGFTSKVDVPGAYFYV